MRKPRLVVSGLMCLAMLGTEAARGAEVPARPNIVVILANDLGYGEVGCYGQAVIQTPRR